MGAPIVFGDHLHVLMMVPSIQLVLDAEVREVHALIEIRQVVFVRPPFDLVLVTVGSSIAVRSPAIPFLKPFLILTLEFVIEDDAMDVGALFAQPLFFAKVGAIQMGIMRQLPRSTDVRVERLRPLVIPVTAMRLQQMASALR